MSYLAYVVHSRLWVIAVLLGGCATPSPALSGSMSATPAPSVDIDWDCDFATLSLSFNDTTLYAAATQAGLRADDPSTSVFSYPIGFKQADLNASWMDYVLLVVLGPLASFGTEGDRFGWPDNRMFLYPSGAAMFVSSTNASAADVRPLAASFAANLSSMDTVERR